MCVITLVIEVIFIMMGVVVFAVLAGTIKPLLVMHKQQEEFYQRLQIMIPLCATIIVAMVTVVFAYLYCRRRRGQLRYKGMP